MYEVKNTVNKCKIKMAAIQNKTIFNVDTLRRLTSYNNNNMYLKSNIQQVQWTIKHYYIQS